MERTPNSGKIDDAMAWFTIRVSQGATFYKGPTTIVSGNFSSGVGAAGFRILPDRGPSESTVGPTPQAQGSLTISSAYRSTQ